MTDRSKAATLRRKREAFLQHKSGSSIPTIAKQMGISERMVYRYIEEFELVRLRSWQAAFNEALRVTPLSATVRQLVAVIEEKTKAS